LRDSDAEKDAGDPRNVFPGRRRGYGSKKGYEFRPMELFVTLTKVKGTLRVDTFLVDAEEFQNVKWIRIHRN